MLIPDHLNHSETKIFEAVENWQNASSKVIKELTKLKKVNEKDSK